MTASRVFKGQHIGSNTEVLRRGSLDVDLNALTLRIHDGETAGGVGLFDTPTDYQQTGQVLHVDGARTDSYEPTGTIIKPFKTIQAALNHSNPNTTILIAPGDYNENIVIPDCDGLAIVGSSEMNTRIINVGSNPTITWVPPADTGANVNTFALKYLTVINNNSLDAIHIDAHLVQYPDVFCGDEFDISEVDFDGSMYFRNTGVVYWNHGDCQGDLNVVDCSVFRTRNVEVGSLASPTNFNAIYEGAHDIHNGLGRSDYTIAAGTVVFGNLVITGHPIVQLDITSLIVGNVVGTAMTSFYSSGRNYCPLLTLYGQIGLAGGGQGNITLNFPDPQLSSTGATAYNLVDLSNAMIAGNVTLSKAGTGPSDAPARQYAVIAGQAQFDKGTTSSITLHGQVAIDLKGAVFTQASLTTDTPSVSLADRNFITYNNNAVTTGGTAVAIIPMLPPGTTYAVTATPTTAITVSVPHSGKTSAGFGIVGSGNGNADILVTRL